MALCANMRKVQICQCLIWEGNFTSIWNLKVWELLTYRIKIIHQNVISLSSPTDSFKTFYPSKIFFSSQDNVKSPDHFQTIMILITLDCFLWTDYLVLHHFKFFPSEDFLLLSILCKVQEDFPYHSSLGSPFFHLNNSQPLSRTHSKHSYPKPTVQKSLQVIKIKFA